MNIKKILFVFILLAAVIFGKLWGQNVLISTLGNPTEPSIIIDPNNTDNLVAGANINYYFYSHDGGTTWTTQNMSSSYGVWGDTSIDVDENGDFYFFHLSNPPDGSWIDRIVCQKSTDEGEHWSDGTFTGLNETKAQDKQWSVIDYNNGNIYLTWTQFDSYGSDDPNDKSSIMFSKSTDSGESWTPAKKINIIDGDCIDSNNTVEGATPAVGPNGEVYVTWVGPNGLVFSRSTDEGETWLSEEIIIDPMELAGWDYSIPGIMRANGLPISKCDLSGGENHGTLYVNWSDQRNGTSDTDVWLVKSEDGGNTWSAPTRVNNDAPGKQQFFTWMDIDQTNGNLFFVFYDRRNYDDNLTDVYMATSINAGNSFINKQISDSPFLPTPSIFFGDYTNITAHDNIVRPIWTRLHEGNLSVWTNTVPFEDLLVTDQEAEFDLSSGISQYPNPATDKTYVSFKLRASSKVSLLLYNQQGALVKTIVKQESKGYGKHILPIDLSQLNLSSGVYYFELIINDSHKMLRNLVVN